MSRSFYSHGPMAEDEDDVRDFANGLRVGLVLLEYGDIDIDRFGSNRGLDAYGNRRFYLAILDQHKVVGLKTDSRNYKYTGKRVG